MGGRVAEELSERLLPRTLMIFDPPFFQYLVYGPQNVTSGASSDIRSATRTAQAMVKVGYS